MKRDLGLHKAASDGFEWMVQTLVNCFLSVGEINPRTKSSRMKDMSSLTSPYKSINLSINLSI